MTIWIDAQLSPALVTWISANFSVQAVALRDVGLRDASDNEIFAAARQANAIVLTKDKDFVDLVNRLGVPPQVIWLTCGNTSNAHLKSVLSNALTQAIELLDAGESLVEISGR
jgi:predicted nuclease of predicted toxin-antitoxin system